MSEHLPPREQLGIVGLIVAGAFGAIPLVAQLAVATTVRTRLVAIANYIVGVAVGGVAAAIFTYPALAPLKTWLANDPWAVAGLIAIFGAPMAPHIVALAQRFLSAKAESAIERIGR